jgi:hemin uptake protein HemP
MVASRPPQPSAELAPAETVATRRPVLSSAALFGGQREIVIRHGREEYRLRITKANKLILTK